MGVAQGPRLTGTDGDPGLVVGLKSRREKDNTFQTYTP